MNDRRSRRVLVLDRNAGKEGPPSVPPGVRAHVVATVSEALRALGESGYDAVMLEVDGERDMSFLVRIRAAAPRVPVIALVPPTSPAIEDLARDEGADDVFSAPPGDGLLRRARRAIQDRLEAGRQLSASIARGRATMARSFELAEIPVTSLRMLLVENDDDQILLTRRAWKSLGLKLDLPVVRDGTRAVEFLERPDAPPTLILLDLRMQGMSGLELLRWIRSRRAFDGTVVFMLSTSSLPEDIEASMSLGADRYFTKPMGYDATVDFLRVLLSRWKLIYRARS